MALCDKFKNQKILRFHKAILFRKIREDLEITIQLARHQELVTQIILNNKYILGAFGEVRKCSNRKTAQVRAVKIIRKDSLDAKEKLRFFSEIDILRQLDHPNIVRLFEIFQDDKRYYLV